MEPRLTYYDNGELKLIEYRDNNFFYHREDGPALRQFYSGGDLWMDMWYLNGKFHRVGGPAYISYLDNNSIHYEEWYFNGKLHRINGPAWINYYSNFEYYYIDGNRYEEDEFLIESRKIKLSSIWNHK